ncbi:hypothetical protein T06_9564 [Trichinella sp. T6]|nr:hypothetical protein T06_9564 [Trichinella sp. T6]
MPNLPELHLVQNRCGGTSLVYEGRAYKLKRAGRQKYWRCSKDKEGCGGAIWTNLDVTSVIKRNDPIESCQFTMYSHWAMRYPKLPKHRRDLQIPVPFRTTKAGEDFLFWQCASKHILIFSTADKIRLLAAMKTLAHTRLYHNDIGTYGFIFQALLNKVAVIGVNLNPQTIICDFETALIPVIQGYFPNTRVQGCYFHFCQAVHRKVDELGLKTRYRRIYKLKRAGKQKYWRCSKVCAECTACVPKVPAGIDRKDHVETCRVDEHMAYID